MIRRTRSLIARSLPVLVRRRLEPWTLSLRTWNVLEFGYGHFKSTKLRSAVDANGNALPWYTYPAIDYLRQLDFGAKDIFEYGSGNSTLFWSQLARSVTSIENDAAWYRRVRAELAATSNVELRLVPDEAVFANTVLEYPNGFDVIVIDGSFARYESARNALHRLRPGGFIMLDNSDWYVKASRTLRDAGLIQVDMIGFAPMNSYISSTSFFIDRAFAFAPRLGDEPVLAVGNQRQVIDE